MKDMYTKKHTVTPQVAAAWLEKNHNVRSMTSGWVRYFSQLILRGEFVPTPDGICFDAAGNLVNGQHRLAAIVMSGVAVEMWVWYNVPPEVVDALDQGRRRRVADILGLDKRVADALSFALRVTYGPGYVPPGAVHELAETQFGEAAAQLVGHCGSTARYFSAVPVKVAAIVQMLRGHQDYVLATYSDLANSRLANLPRVAAAYVNQFGRGTARGVATDKYDALARALVVFDPGKQDLSKIQINDAAKIAATESVRLLVRKHLRDGASQGTA